MDELFKNNPISKAPDFFNEEQNTYVNSKIQTLTQGASVDLSRQIEQNSYKIETVRTDAKYYEDEYRQQQGLADYEKYCQQKTSEIDANPKYSRFRKKKALKKEKNRLERNRDQLINDFASKASFPEMVSEARVQEADENLKYFTEVETLHSIEIEKAKALFSPEEREKFKKDRNINLLLFHDNLQTDHTKNQKLVSGYLSEDFQVRQEFVKDIYNEVNTMPTNIFLFNNPLDFKSKLPEMHKATQKILTYTTILKGNYTGEQSAIKEADPALAQAFEDKMDYFSKYTKLLGIYKNHLSTGSDFGATDSLRKITAEKGGDSSLFPYKETFLEESAKTDIRFGETTYEERLEKRNIEREKFETAKTRYEAAVALLNKDSSEPEGELISPKLFQQKLEAITAQQEFLPLAQSYITRYGYNLDLPEDTKIEFTEKEQEYDQALKECKKREDKYLQSIESFKTITQKPDAKLSNIYAPDSLKPLFYEALMEEYGELYGKHSLEEKEKISHAYNYFNKAEQNLFKLTNPREVGETHCPQELPAEFVMTEKEKEFMKLTIGAFRVEGEEDNLGEPLFRSFSSFGNFGDLDAALTKEELKLMLRNLGAGGNLKDNVDAQQSQIIRDKNLAGAKTYKKVLQKHYTDMFKKYGDVDKMSLEERISRKNEISDAFSNMQVDNHWVDRFPKLFNSPEDEALVNIIHYYNYTSAYMIISESNIAQMGFDMAKEMDDQLHELLRTNPDFIKSKKALFK